MVSLFGNKQILSLENETHISTVHTINLFCKHLLNAVPGP